MNGDILADLEQVMGNPEEAGRARKKAIQLFLAYRRDGGENHSSGGRLCLWFENALQKQPPEEIEKRLVEMENDPKTSQPIKTLVSKLQIVLAGYFDTGLAEDPDLYYRDAAEFLFLLEKLTKRK